MGNDSMDHIGVWLSTEHGPRTMVQVYFVTIGGKVYAMLGPVTYLPELGIDAGTIEGFEAGDVIPAEAAAGFLLAERGGGAWARSREH